MFILFGLAISALSDLKTVKTVFWYLIRLAIFSFAVLCRHQYLWIMESNILATESFATRKRRYFLDFKKAANNTNFIQLTRSDEQLDGTYTRNQVCVFQEDFPLLVQAMSSLFHHAAYLDQKDMGIKDGRNDPLKSVKGIKGWEPDMRPREKMLGKGAEALSDVELLALLIGSGTVKETAVGLCERILKALDGSLENLAKADYKFLGRFAGMGMAKSSAIIGAVELARRLVRGHLGSATSFLVEVGT